MSVNLYTLVKTAKTAEAECRKILADCDNPNISFPSYSDEYDIAAYLFNLFSIEDESYPQKAFINALQAIKSGFHTCQNIGIASDYLYNTKNVSGLRQLCNLILDKNFCLRHTPESARFINGIIDQYKELSKTELDTPFILFTEEEKALIFELCRSHIRTIERWKLCREQEQALMQKGYAGVRDCRRELYSLNYKGINLSYQDCEKSEYDDLKTRISFARRRLKK